MKAPLINVEIICPNESGMDTTVHVLLTRVPVVGEDVRYDDERTIAVQYVTHTPGNISPSPREHGASPDQDYTIHAIVRGKLTGSRSA